MELVTYDRNYVKQETIDKFISCIWTERYYGNSEFELVVPTSVANAQALKPGTLVNLKDTYEFHILETANFQKDGSLKATGMSVLPWLNNRFIRTSDKHEDRYWYLNMRPGELMAHIVQQMCIDGDWLNGVKPMGVPNPQSLKIPGLFLYAYDTSGDVINYGVPYGPVFDALNEIATTYGIGQSIQVNNNPENNPYRLRYRNYKGLDRSSSQSTNSLVRFSEQFDSLTDVEEVQSIAGYKTVVYSYAPGHPEGVIPTSPGMASRVFTQATGEGLDLRAQMVFAEDITTDQVEGDVNKLMGILNSRASDALSNAEYVRIVDGEIVPTSQFKYGRDYGLGDIIEIQGNTGAISKARVTEYIRAQDESGEKAYPTVALLG